MNYTAILGHLRTQSDNAVDERKLLLTMLPVSMPLFFSHMSWLLILLILVVAADSCDLGRGTLL